MNDTRLEDSLASAAYIAEGKDLVNNTGSSLLFNRIINIKFIRKKPDKNGSNYFCIRSDYEPVYHADGSVQFIKCGQKPAITISYDQVASSTVINVKIKVESLFIDRTIAGEEIDAAGGNPVVSAVVQLGYIDEFPRWDLAGPEVSSDAFFDMDNDAFDGKNGFMTGKLLNVQILYAYSESNPPDRSWVFVGTIGTFDVGFRWNHTMADLTPGYGNDKFPGGKSKIEMMLYQWITRRFVRPGVEHVAAAVQVPSTGHATVTTAAVRVKNYAKFRPDTKLIPDTGGFTTLVPDADGLMTPADADAIGVQCVCSEYLRSMSSADIPRYGVLQPDMAVAEASKSAVAGIGAGFLLFDEPYETMQSQLNGITNHYTFIRYRMMLDGSLFLYHVDEDSSNFITDPAIKLKQAGAIKLWAVYDITMSGMRVIRCPFRQLIDPMTTVLFQSRYRITDITGNYYQPAVTHDAFLVILSSLEFSTTGPENTLTLSCVDIPSVQAPVVNYETGAVTVVPGEPASAQHYSSDPTQAKADYEKSWVESTLTVGVFPYDAVDLRWIDIAKSIIASASPSDWPSGLPTLSLALADLASWNSAGPWNSGRMVNSNGFASPENGLVPGLSVSIPWLYSGDKVIIRQPYKASASYDNSYLKGSIKLNG